ncbi:MAG: A/G-specific adenine glycosylase [Bacilli bacterium]|nr:A/G-specific adenine glycosylase [Bacilli bacterium]
MSKVELVKIVKPLINWYQKEKRDLPWRRTEDPYKIWISEIMLQQTRVEAVKEYYKRFIKEIPTLESLADIDEDKLLKLWEGLGYYSRARNLKKCAQEIIKNNMKTLPGDYNSLKSLPGIGPYAAGAIGSIAFHLKTPAIDGNVMRVMSRIHEDARELNLKVRQEYYQRLQEIMPNNTRDFTESLMELGALICLPNGSPLCNKCPLSFLCQSYHHHTMQNFPTKTKEKERKIVEKTILIFEYKGKYGIQKRSDSGLLASMYEFYAIDQKLNLEEIINKLSLKKDEIKILGSAKHIFSHLEWHMEGYLIKCKEAPNLSLMWATKEEIKNKYSIPNAYLKYIKKLF